jgi:isopentenyl-diphosphate delta-isomerase
VATFDDQLIQVDLQDKYIGPISKKNAHLWESITKDSLYHRAFSIFLFSPDSSSLLLQKRSKIKVTFPLRWTNTCCSHPLHTKQELEETRGSQLSASRRLDFEMGMKIPPERFKTVGRIAYKAPCDEGFWGEAELDHVLICRATEREIHFSLNEHEVEEAEWVKIEKINDFLLEKKEKKVKKLSRVYKKALGRNFNALV